MFLKNLILTALSFISLNLASQVDTLVPPVTIKVSYNIANNNVQIFWNPSESESTTEYEVWYADGNATLDIISYQKVDPSDRINASDPLVYEFSHKTEEGHSNGYFIKAYGPNGAESGITICDSTVFLKVKFDTCSGSATLQWNDYNRWRGNTAGYKVYASTDKTNYTLRQTTDAGTTNCVIDNLQANQLYSFYVLAMKNIPADSSYSLRVDVNTKMAVIPSYLTANYGTAESGHPVVSFSIDPVSELNHFELLRADSPSGPYDSLTTIYTSSKTIDYSDITADASLQPYYYKLNAYNYCGNEIRTSDNMAGTIFLQSSISNNIITLNWNSYQNWPEGIEYYRIERSIGVAYYETVATTSDLSYIDHSFEGSANNPDESTICYRVTAVKNLASSNPAASISNEQCMELNSNMRFEFNAFTPGGASNNSFGPAMDFIPESITFSIYNRWGELLYKSSDPNSMRWDGTYKNRKVDQGVYRYQLEYINEQGKKSVIHGNVTVVYP